MSEEVLTVSVRLGGFQRSSSPQDNSHDAIVVDRVLLLTGEIASSDAHSYRRGLPCLVQILPEPTTYAKDEGLAGSQTREP